MKNLFLATILFLFFCITAQTQIFAKQTQQKVNAPSSESYTSMTFNGAWCWFSDPRAVYFEGEHKRTYSGWVDNFGDIHVASYDHDTHQIETKVIYDNLEIDDHDNPSILIDSEGRLMVFFNTHTLGARPLYMVKSTQPESISSWSPVKELYLNAKSDDGHRNMHHTYTNPVRLSGENGRIYIFWRGADGKPSYSTSDDDGENWAEGKIFFMPEAIYAFRRPYTKIYSDGKDKIHITVTDGHPRNETENNIYYICYQKGAFYKADGTLIKRVEDLPILPTEADLVYNAKQGGAKAWNWDIAQKEDGSPVIAYAKFPNDSTHIYAYANFHNKKWNSYDLINSGGWFPETMEGQEEPEPNYSGGMSIDHESPNTLYLSVKRKSVFEIEKWSSPNHGKSWKVQKITDGSAKDNIRPFAVRDAKTGNPVQVLWMQNTRYPHFAYGRRFKAMGGAFEDRFLTSIKMDRLSSTITNPLDKGDILNVMRQTADWQFANPTTDKRAPLLNWHYGVYYSGVRALYEVTGENRYKDELMNIGQAHDWQPMDQIYNADRLTIIDTWAWLYSIDKEEKIIDKSQWVLDIHLGRDYHKHTNVSFKNNPLFHEWWSWCDALFMAPPAFAEMWKVTGETKYLVYMNEQWWKTSDYLYSKDDSLYYRDDRYFDKLSANDKKIFWGRGNGWVIAGLAKVLTLLPQDFAERPKFEQQYKEMAAKLLSIQGKDGLWRVSLLDPKFLDMGESSGSALFTYALAWGLNNGLVDMKYRPRIEQAWMALCENVNGEGRLGYVQQVAGDPYPFTKDQWHVYATGAFLMAGKQMYQMADK